MENNSNTLVMTMRSEKLQMFFHVTTVSDNGLNFCP